ncbi:MAG TPA: right-handed parallel beta-helix repeat-containing protein [Acidimicrobiales bacterium]|nr:right-handed parallel beta-helix repeat-containing protein [Acidimicrobiales bacterium]
MGRVPTATGGGHAPAAGGGRLALAALAALAASAVGSAWPATAWPVGAAVGAAGAATTTASTLVTTPARAATQQGLLDQDHLDISAMNHAIIGKTAPFIYATPGRGRPTLILVGGGSPYRLRDLVRQFPDAFASTGTGGVVLEIPMVVAPGAALEVSSATVPALYLRSDATGYAFIAAVHASISFDGTAAKPLVVSSLDPSTETADQDESDGRAYVVAEASRMTLDHVQVAQLGYLTGVSSGTAWIPYSSVPSAGSAVSSTFTGNYNGAYASGSPNLTFTDDRFVQSTNYGLCLHGSRDSRVTGSQAAGNGIHGIVVNDASSGVQVTSTSSDDNGGMGFFVTGSRLPDGRQANPSNDVTLDHVTAEGNLSAAVLLHGGKGQKVEHAIARDNEAGILVNGGSTGAVVRADRVIDSQAEAIEVSAGSGGASIEDNQIRGASTAIVSNLATPTAIVGNHVVGIHGSGIKVFGNLSKVTLRDNTVAGTGANPIYLNGVGTGSTEGIDAHQWITPGINWWIRPLEIALWSLVLVPPLLFWFWGRRRRAAVRAAREAQA